MSDQNDKSKPPAGNPLDINSANFDCDTYLAQALKTKRLDDLLDVELTMCKEVRSLECEMEQLVYENYAKFIVATDTIKQLQTDFVAMEGQMDKLALNMHKIGALSDRLGGALADKHANVNKLATANRTLKNLQFLFDLPTTLQTHVDREEYKQCAQAYVRTKEALHRYGTSTALSGISAECETIVDELRSLLRRQLCAVNAEEGTDHLLDGSESTLISARRTGDTVDCLLMLGDEPEELAEIYLRRARDHLDNMLRSLDGQYRLKRGDVDDGRSPMDVLEFVDSGVSALLGDMSLLVTTYTQLFAQHDAKRSVEENEHINQTAMRGVLQLANGVLAECLHICEQRFLLDTSATDSSLLVRALDRFYRRLAATSQLLPGSVAYHASSITVLAKVGDKQIELVLQHMVNEMNAHVKQARTQLAQAHKSLHTPSMLAVDNSSGGSGGQSAGILADVLVTLENSCVYDIKISLANLLQFVTCDVTYAQEQQRFVRPFARSVRENLLVAYCTALEHVCEEYCEGSGDKMYVNSTLILLLSRLCYNLHSSTITRVVELCEQQFGLATDRPSASNANHAERLTPTAVMCESMGGMAQRLIDKYVEMESATLSQLLVKSVQSRDWLTSAEPRAIRAVVKRVLEDIAAIDGRVAQLYTENIHTDRSSDGSRRSGGGHRRGTAPRLLTAGGQDDMAQPSSMSSINNALGKLWTERIDYVLNAHFNRQSVLTCIVKMSLKTLLECVRMTTFGSFGCQQMQVDCHYLWQQLYTYCDDRQVQGILDEVVLSAEQRCPHANTRMSPAVLDSIANRG